MAMGTFHDTVFVGAAQVVAAGHQAVVSAKGSVAGGDVGGVTAVAIAAGGREPICTQFPRHTTTGRHGVLQALRESHETLAALDHLAPRPAAPGQPVMKQQVGKGFPRTVIATRLTLVKSQNASSPG